VLVEGFKQTPISKLEIHRPSYGKPPIWPENKSVVAVATDAPLECPLPTHLPQLDLNDPDAIVQFILDYLDRPC
jgi:molybdopterin-guanine dinucleotide biosynthesis protein B